LDLIPCLWGCHVGSKPEGRSPKRSARSPIRVPSTVL
jgi:hypothetical protein